MDVPQHAVTYLLEKLEHAVSIAAQNGVRILTPAETAIALPHYPGFGVLSDVTESTCPQPLLSA